MSDRIPKIYYSNAGEETDAETLRRRQNNRMIQTTIVGISILILVLALVLGWNIQLTGNTPKPTGEVSGDIDTSHDPLQMAYTGEQVIKQIDGFNITPVANYELSAVVESVKFFSDSQGFGGDRIFAKISPADLCLSWGKLAEPEYNEYVDFTPGKVGSGRACYFKTKSGFPFDQKYLIAHASNNHVIPATGNVIRAIKSIKIKDKVVLKGYLVNAIGNCNGREYTYLKTSLIRGDWGLEGCEVFYVKSVRIGNKVYE